MGHNTLMCDSHNYTRFYTHIMYLLQTLLGYVIFGLAPTPDGGGLLCLFWGSSWRGIKSVLFLSVIHPAAPFGTWWYGDDGLGMAAGGNVIGTDGWEQGDLLPRRSTRLGALNDWWTSLSRSFSMIWKEFELNIQHEKPNPNILRIIILTRWLFMFLLFLTVNLNLWSYVSVKFSSP